MTMTWHTKHEHYHTLNNEIAEWAKTHVGERWDLETTYTFIWFDGEEHLFREDVREKILKKMAGHPPIPATHRRLYNLYQNYNHAPAKTYFTYIDVPAEDCYQKER
ncbi:hypothetical protein PHOBOS_190 [Erwinia phage vB_EamM_Phobos]|uniref:hypothetical protein n=1 Tax=Erwinia phage vB_EamM_Phobos TaxID=1883377 RepID=UPI00081C87C4|nr:hypothetical protein BIZ79_gp190 [Erwinia phage vB_EamM_Phobos]ANZ50380.1 hypothetical protein PHOBOS_190 [Erwinia phage vB_EamM_Phobos]